MASGHDGYGQYCPISRALDLLGERWTLVIIRDLLVGTTRFNDLARGNQRADGERQQSQDALHVYS